MNKEIKEIKLDDKNYPKLLKNIKNPPQKLYVMGNENILNDNCFSIIGSRSCTENGMKTAKQYAKQLVKLGLCISSGMAKGIDTAGHIGALEGGGKTIAVVGSGFNNIYPATNTTLSLEIAERGLLLSEYPPSFKPKRYTFPRRNRIVAGLSDGVLIVEAGIKSGTIHTKEYALEYGKDIFAVPGNITSNKSELTNQLIKSGQAECVLSADEIVDFYGMKKAEKQKMLTLSFDEKSVVDALADGEKDFDFLSRKTKIPVNILNSCLTTLEIRGLIRKLPAQCYALI